MWRRLFCACMACLLVEGGNAIQKTYVVEEEKPAVSIPFAQYEDEEGKNLCKDEEANPIVIESKSDGTVAFEKGYFYRMEETAGYHHNKEMYTSLDTRISVEPLHVRLAYETEEEIETQLFLYEEETLIQQCLLEEDMDIGSILQEGHTYRLEGKCAQGYRLYVSPAVFTVEEEDLVIQVTREKHVRYK